MYKVKKQEGLERETVKFPADIVEPYIIECQVLAVQQRKWYDVLLTSEKGLFVFNL